MNIDQDSASVRIPPPIVLLLFFIIGYVIQKFVPVSFLPRTFSGLSGILLIVFAIAVNLFCGFTFRKFKTDIRPWRTTTNIIKIGPYKYSRNPMYVGFLILMVGLACLFNSIWILLMTIPLFLFLNKYVIAKEEAYLTNKFGQDYVTYTQQVRRWI